MTAPPDLYGVVGHPVSHSRSPQIHRLFASQTGQNLDYVLLDAEPGEFASAVKGFRDRGGKGLNVTVPYKEEAYTIVTRCSQRARLAGAVNTLAWFDGDLVGDNTDGAGLTRDLQANLGVAIEGASVLLVGAGGAARGAVAPLLECGARRLVVANRTPERAAELVAHFGSSPRLRSIALQDVGGPFDLVVNATSASLHGQIPGIPPAAVGATTFCYDMMYAKEPTAFMIWARDLGAAAADGLGMLVEQAAESFFLWRGIRPDTTAVLKQVRSGLV